MQQQHLPQKHLKTAERKTRETNAANILTRHRDAVPLAAVGAAKCFRFARGSVAHFLRFQVDDHAESLKETEAAAARVVP